MNGLLNGLNGQVLEVDAPATDEGAGNGEAVDYKQKVLEQLSAVKPKDAENLSYILDGLLKQYEQQERVEAEYKAFHEDTTHLHDRRDILLTADEYSLGVVKEGNPESDEDYEYRDIADIQPLVDEGILELQRHEIRVSGETVDIYALTDKGRAEIEAEAAPASEPEPETEPTIDEIRDARKSTDFGDEFLQPIEHISRYVFAHLLMSYTGSRMFEHEGVNFDDQWEEIHFLYMDIRDGVRHAFPGIQSNAMNDAIYACENKSFF